MPPTASSREARRARGAAQSVLRRAERDLAAARAAVAGFGTSAQTATTATAHVVELEAGVVDLIGRLRAAGEAVDIGTYNNLVAQLRDSSGELVTAFTQLEQPFRAFSDALEVLPSAHCSAPVATTLRWTAYGKDGLECARLRVPLDYSRPTDATDPGHRRAAARRRQGQPRSAVPQPRRSRALRHLVDARRDHPDAARGAAEVRPRRDGPPRRRPEHAGRLRRRPRSPVRPASSPTPAADDERPIHRPGRHHRPGLPSSQRPGHRPRRHGERRPRHGPGARRRWASEQLSYLGYSYGTYLGAVYADLFPTPGARRRARRRGRPARADRCRRRGRGPDLPRLLSASRSTTAAATPGAHSMPVAIPRVPTTASWTGSRPTPLNGDGHRDRPDARGDRGRGRPLRRRGRVARA